jgi:hypothetical protein
MVPALKLSFDGEWGGGRLAGDIGGRTYTVRKRDSVECGRCSRHRDGLPAWVQAHPTRLFRVPPSGGSSSPADLGSLAVTREELAVPKDFQTRLKAVLQTKRTTGTRFTQFTWTERCALLPGPARPAISFVHYFRARGVLCVYGTLS